MYLEEVITHTGLRLIGHCFVRQHQQIQKFCEKKISASKTEKNYLPFQRVLGLAEPIFLTISKAHALSFQMSILIDYFRSKLTSAFIEWGIFFEPIFGQISKILYYSFIVAQFWHQISSFQEWLWGTKNGKKLIRGFLHT